MTAMYIRRKERLIIFSIGIIILALGISLTILSNFGTSPFDALLVGLSETIGLTVGSWEVILALILVFSNALITWERPEFLGLVTAMMTGVCIDFWLYLLRGIIAPEYWFWQFACLMAGLVVIGLGTAIYLYTNFAPIPVDRFTLIVKKWTKGSIFFARTVIYAIFLVAAFLSNGPIGIGTVLTVAFGGMILSFFMPRVERWIRSGQPSLQRYRDKTH